MLGDSAEESVVSDIKKKLKLIGIILAVIAFFAVLIYFRIFWWTMLGLLVLIVVLLHFSVSIHLKASRAEGIDIKAKWLFLTLYPRGKKKDNKPIPIDDFAGDGFEDFSDLPDIEPPSEDDSSGEKPPTVEELAAAAEKIDKEEAESPPEGEKSEDEPSEKPSEDKPAKKKKEKLKKDEAPKEKGKGKIAALKEKFNKIRPYIPIGWKAVKKFCKAIRFEDVDLRAEVGRFDAHETVIWYGAIEKVMFDILSKIGLIFTLKVKHADVRCDFGENKIDGAAELTVRVRPSTMIAIAFCTGVNFLIVFFRERRKRKKAAKLQAEAA